MALLLRRLRARLRIPNGHLICAGTSATLGGAADTTPLRDYARHIFGVAFDEASVITESRQTAGEFLEDAPVDFMFSFRPDVVQQGQAQRGRTRSQAVSVCFGVFFPDAAPPRDVNDVDWRQELGRLLKRHQLFVNLLKRIKHQVLTYAELRDTLARHMPTASPDEVIWVLDALLVLVSWALGSNGKSLVTLRVQLWVRELRRMVACLSATPENVKFRSERDLPSQRDGVYLPLVQCSQCRTTGWISRLVEGSSRLSTQLDEVYNTWFAKRPEATRLYANASVGPRSHVDGVRQWVCVGCGTLQHADGECLACGHKELMQVFRVTARKTQQRGGAQFTLHDNTCPACGEANELLLLGARNATLGAQVVESTWASVFNDDKKLIAFSDSVQDAAHRAGFFGARTYLNNVRTALAQVLDELDERDGGKGLDWVWQDVLTELQRRFDTEGSVLKRSPEELVSEFIAPNMMWQRDWAVELQQHRRLPTQSRLPERVKKRLLWQAYSEFTYQSQRGRTLERTGKAVLTVPWASIDATAQHLQTHYREHYGTHGLEQATIAQWLWGMLTHMRRRGGVMHPELSAYAGDGNVYAFTKTAGRNEWLPNMGEHTPHPVFLTQGTQKGFDKLSGVRRATWYDRWAEAALGHQTLLGKGMAEQMYAQALQTLQANGVVQRIAHHQGDTWALNPQSLRLYTAVVFMATRDGKRRLPVPAAVAEHLMGMPCVDAPEQTYTWHLPPTMQWWAQRYSRGDLRRVIAAEHTGLLAREDREALEARFKSKQPQPWFENLLSATPTLEMGVDIGDLSSVLLCSVPPNQASFLQRVGRAGRRDGNAMTTTLADGNSPHDLYFFAQTEEMLTGEVAPPGVFLRAAEVLKRQLFAYCMDDWVASLDNDRAMPERTSQALDAMDQDKQDRFPYLLCDHVLLHEQRLFDGFMDLLAPDVDEVVRGRLRDFMQGQGTADGLRTRLIKVLQELLEERRSYKRRKDELDRSKAKLQQRPQDDTTREEMDDLLRERGKLMELIKEINERDVLNTLTDGGLIPNYAFPESGVELKSVLWRKRASDEPGQGAYIALGALKYERPAQSALSEFAPENRFYANQRRVEVDQINMNLAKAEDWRFCPSCHHMQHLIQVPDVHAQCPRCGDPMWADAAQRRTLLRFKQAIANSNDAEVRIDDSVEDREPRSYVRELMADVAKEHIREAWRVPAGEVSFGFEFIARVTFRDVNFGELAKPGESFKVANKESSRPGFKVCKHCGKVQKPSKAHADASAQSHAFDCPKRNSQEPDNLLTCLYLYREFESEALRILVPYTKNGVDDRVVQSFMAAVQLGLKKRFGGKVDHLRMALQDEPGKDGGPRRHYVMLYDSVPGGTGYLHQLLAHDASTLTDVLNMALHALSTCDCNQDPEKDGCYRCLFQYRLGRKMELVSRDSAKKVLHDLASAMNRLERVETISEIYINPLFDSVLEARFIESLTRLSGMGGCPKLKLVSDVVHGKTGYVLEVAGQRYKIEPQRQLGPEDGVAVTSKPDFVIWPWSNTARRKPIAVFCDGWAYHKSALREDALKRSALVNSGRFWVWSVTHNDVVSALKGETGTDLESPLLTWSRHHGEKASPKIPRAQEKAFTLHAIARLLLWLGGAEEASSGDVMLKQLQRNALWLGFLMVPSSRQQQTDCEAQWEQWMPLLPDHLQVVPKGYAPSLSKTTAVCGYVGHWPLAVAQTGLDALDHTQASGLVMLDDTPTSDEQMLHNPWRHWLHIFNTMQTLPGVGLATVTGLQAHDHVHLLAGSQAHPSSTPSHSVAVSAHWQAVLDNVFKPLRSGLEQLATLGVDAPDVGMELTNDKGRVLADAELCWPTLKWALLRADQHDLAAIWQTHGWRTWTLDEQMGLNGGDWHSVVARDLGMAKSEQE